MAIYCNQCGATHECSVCPVCHGFGKTAMTTDELRAKFEAWCLHRGINTEKRSNGHYLSDEVCFWWKLWSDAHASRDAEVEALKKRVGNVVRQMKNCASDITKAPSLTGQWVADTINWFVDEIDIDAAMREESK